jgi:hydroxymethylglutaryl-CoA reductase
VGLANNFSALLALSGEGIQKGHMKLHGRSVASFVGASDSEVDELAKILSDSSDYSESFAKSSLEKMRKSKKS